MVGDSPELDYDAALRAGLMAVLLDRDERQRESGRPSIRTLAQVLSRQDRAFIIYRACSPTSSGAPVRSRVLRARRRCLPSDA